MGKKTIYEYMDYRLFLKEAFALLKQQDKKFSFRYFSKQAGFKSQSVLKLVMDGKMNISTPNIEVFAKIFRLNKSEANFFYHLVLMNQAKTSEVRQLHAQEILKSKAYKKLYPLSQLQMNYYKHWYYIPVRELVALKGFRNDFDWIAKKLNPKITAQEAKKAIDELTALGLIRRNANNELEQVDENISTGDEVVHKTIPVYHKEMLKKAIEAVDRYPISSRDISSVTLGVSAKNLKMIKEMVQKFRKELLAAASSGDDPNQVFQINFQVFPLSLETDDGDE